VTEIAKLFPMSVYVVHILLGI